MKRFLLAISFFLFAEEEIHEFSGRHFLASYLGCNEQSLKDLLSLEDAMHNAVVASNATILDRSCHIFDPDGMTILYLLSESHASIHTYPEKSSCFVDLFTCGTKCSSENFDRILREYLKPTKVIYMTVERNECMKIKDLDSYSQN